MSEILIIYLVVAVLNYGAAYAYWTNKFRMTDSDENRASDRAFSLFWAILSPITVLITPFVTGLFYYGFQWSGGPRLTR